MNHMLSIVTVLRACPAHEVGVSRELFLECWGELQRQNVTRHIKPTVPVMAAIILHDDRFARLLNEAEQAQLRALIQLALDRYEQTINPPNKLGRLLAAIIEKESS
jgi:hypothetical protein